MSMPNVLVGTLVGFVAPKVDNNNCLVFSTGSCSRFTDPGLYMIFDSLSQRTPGFFLPVPVVLDYVLLLLYT